MIYGTIGKTCASLICYGPTMDDDTRAECIRLIKELDAIFARERMLLERARLSSVADLIPGLVLDGDAELDPDLS